MLYVYMYVSVGSIVMRSHPNNAFWHIHWVAVNALHFQPKMCAHFQIGSIYLRIFSCCQTFFEEFRKKMALKWHILLQIKLNGFYFQQKFLWPSLCQCQVVCCDINAIICLKPFDRLTRNAACQYTQSWYAYYIQSPPQLPTYTANVTDNYGNTHIHRWIRSHWHGHVWNMYV